MNGAGLTWASEKASYINGSFVANGAVTDGCGVAQPSVTIPWYQIGIGATSADWNSGVSDTYRNVPDVSIADGWVEYDLDGIRTAMGGTSASSPIFAGFMALVNEQSIKSGFGSVGFANPAFYGIAKTKATVAPDAYDNSFNDIKTGAAEKTVCSRDPGSGQCNCNYDLNAGNSAGTGFDLATGIGTPKFGLITQLASSSPLPPQGVAAGGAHACAIRQNGSVWCWGWNASGQLGNGLIDMGGPCPNDADSCDVPFNPHFPSPVLGLNNGAVAISAGYDSTCAVLGGATVWCWGLNYGPLPVQVSGLENAKYVAVGGLATCALMADSTVRCWGDNSTGQLGNGTNVDSSVPVTVSGISTAVAIRSNPFGGSTCALMNSDTVECWGSNEFGQLGNGTLIDSNIPVSVVGLSSVASIAVGGLNACAVLVDGRVACWGNNTEGELGDGTTNNSSLPVFVSGLTNAREVAMGDASTCAVLTDGTVTCWGNNFFYQLGDGSTDSMEVRLLSGTKVQSLSGLVTDSRYLQAISGGSHDFYCAAVNNGVACWGHDLAGALGDGGQTDSSLPIMARLILP